MDSSQRLVPHPDPALARLEAMFFPAGLTLEDRARLAVRAAALELDAAQAERLRQLPPGARVRQAFSLWRMARDALCRQAIRRGLSPSEAQQEAARRMLEAHNDL